MGSIYKSLVVLFLTLAVAKYFSHKELQHQILATAVVADFARHASDKLNDARNISYEISSSLRINNLSDPSVKNLADSLSRLYIIHKLKHPEKIKETFLNSGYVSQFEVPYESSDSLEWLTKLKSLYFLTEGWKQVMDSVSCLDHNIPIQKFEIFLTEANKLPNNRMNIQIAAIEKISTENLEIQKNGHRIKVNNFPIKEVSVGDLIEIKMTDTITLESKFWRKQY